LDVNNALLNGLLEEEAS